MMIDNKDIGLKNYGETLLESLKNSLKNRDSIRKDRYSRMADGSTDIDDCFVSMRVEDHNDQLTNAKIYILENKGFSRFEKLIDLDTNKDTGAKEINGRYGPCWILPDEYVEAKGLNSKFVGIPVVPYDPDPDVAYDAKAEALYKAKMNIKYAKKGYKVEKRKCAAWACTRSHGNGMYGAVFGSYVKTFESDYNYWTGKPVKNGSVK